MIRAARATRNNMYSLLSWHQTLSWAPNNRHPVHDLRNNSDDPNFQYANYTIHCQSSILALRKQVCTTWPQRHYRPKRHDPITKAPPPPPPPPPSVLHVLHKPSANKYNRRSRAAGSDAHYNAVAHPGEANGCRCCTAACTACLKRCWCLIDGGASRIRAAHATILA